jgi:hypothetical protein
MQFFQCARIFLVKGQVEVSAIRFSPIPLSDPRKIPWESEALLHIPEGETNREQP